MHGVASLSLISSRVAGLSQTSRLCLGALTLALATAFTADADASVIGFAADSANVITTSYDGFNWSNSYGSSAWVNGTAVPIGGNTPPAPLGYDWSNGGAGLTVTLASPGTFTFNSIDLASYRAFTPYYDTITGLLNGVTVDSYTATNILSSAFTTYTLDWSNINEVAFSTTLPFANNLLVTNFAFNEAPVPEPSTLSLFGAGLFTFAGFAWYRRRKQAGADLAA
jgi:hypothetical protein